MDNTYAYLIYIILSCLYGIILIKTKIKSILVTIIASCVLITILGCVSRFCAALGSKTTEREWERQDYKIRYVKNQSLFGGTTMEYELYQYTTFPIFMKQVDAKIDTTGSCTIKFELAKFDFNRCSGE
ncbi:hypothetical protein ACFGVS_26475 [Mucilaginibacter sp. AW1-7]|uniref:hypothetical protein n=1 Tax=Mucilaginibacter sp. AW1-7 TaxID=3349874 RepID=UPI003F7364AA